MVETILNWLILNWIVRIKFPRWNYCFHGCDCTSRSLLMLFRFHPPVLEPENNKICYLLSIRIKYLFFIQYFSFWDSHKSLQNHSKITRYHKYYMYKIYIMTMVNLLQRKLRRSFFYQIFTWRSVSWRLRDSSHLRCLVMYLFVRYSVSSSMFWYFE